MRIIFSDIDGTLINDKLEILPRTKESILKEVKKEIFLFLYPQEVLWQCKLSLSS